MLTLAAKKHVKAMVHVSRWAASHNATVTKDSLMMDWYSAQDVQILSSLIHSTVTIHENTSSSPPTLTVLTYHMTCHISSPSKQASQLMTALFSGKVGTTFAHRSRAIALHLTSRLTIYVQNQFMNSRWSNHQQSNFTFQLHQFL